MYDKGENVEEFHKNLFEALRDAGLEPVPQEGLEENDRETILIATEEFYQFDELDLDRYDTSSPQSFGQDLAEDFGLFTSGLFGFSFFMKDIPLAVNTLTSALQITGFDEPEYYESVMGMQEPEEFYAKGN